MGTALADKSKGHGSDRARPGPTWLRQAVPSHVPGLAGARHVGGLRGSVATSRLMAYGNLLLQNIAFGVFVWKLSLENLVVDFLGYAKSISQGFQF